MNSDRNLFFFGNVMVRLSPVPQTEDSDGVSGVPNTRIVIRLGLGASLTSLRNSIERAYQRLSPAAANVTQACRFVDATVAKSERNEDVAA